MIIGSIGHFEEYIDILWQFVKQRSKFENSEVAESVEKGVVFVEFVLVQFLDFLDFDNQEFEIRLLESGDNVLASLQEKHLVDRRADLEIFNVFPWVLGEVLGFEDASDVHLEEESFPVSGVLRMINWR